jgi:hypothetical protein
MRWALESSDDHWTRHDREQVRYWLSRPPVERLAQAESYRARVFMYRQFPQLCIPGCFLVMYGLTAPLPDPK